MREIPYGHQNINNDDIQAAIEVLESDFITQGPAVGLFEETFASYCGAKYAIAVANGMVSLPRSAVSIVKAGAI